MEQPCGIFLFPALFTVSKVGCRVEAFLRQFSGPLRSHLAFQSEHTPTTSLVRFDSNSFLIGVDSHASRCMVNDTHLFEDLRLNENNGQVSGIAEGLAIEGEGTFKFDITDNDGKRHTIRIKNSLYVPKMRRCLLLPQHWARRRRPCPLSSPLSLHPLAPAPSASVAFVYIVIIVATSLPFPSPLQALLLVD